MQIRFSEVLIVGYVNDTNVPRHFIAMSSTDPDRKYYLT